MMIAIKPIKEIEIKTPSQMIAEVLKVISIFSTKSTELDVENSIFAKEYFPNYCTLRNTWIKITMQHKD